jgi:hypothetical protein
MHRTSLLGATLALPLLMPGTPAVRARHSTQGASSTSSPQQLERLACEMDGGRTAAHPPSRRIECERAEGCDHEFP